MAGNAPDRYRRQNKIIPEFVVSITPGSPTNIPIQGQDCDIWITEGVVFVDCENLATVATGLKCGINTLVQLNVKERISLLSTASAKVQILVYE